MAALPLFASFLPNTASLVPPRSTGGASRPDEPVAAGSLLGTAVATHDPASIESLLTGSASGASTSSGSTSLLSGRAARYIDPAHAGSQQSAPASSRRPIARVDSSTGSLFADLPVPLRASPRSAPPSAPSPAPRSASERALTPARPVLQPAPQPASQPASHCASQPALQPARSHHRPALRLPPPPGISPDSSSVPETGPDAASADLARSPIDRTEAALREAGLAGRFWRGDALSVSPLPSTPSGFRLLDEQLPGGGWPSRCLTELLLSHTGVGEIRFLASTLSSLTQAGRQIVLLAPPHIPDPTGWEQLGIDMRRVLIVRAEKPTDRLWAVEESLKSSTFGALLAWLPEEKTLARHDALRRLQSAAASADGLTFLFRPSAAQDHASPAPLRLALSTGAPDGPRRLLSVRMLKRRGPVLAQPLQLMLPEVHRGLKAFGLPSPAAMPGSSEARRFPGASPSSVRPTPASASSPAPAPFIPSIASHALAGPLLSHAVA